MAWWFQHGLAGWFVLSLIWGVLTIVYDSLIALWYGGQDTISWQTQQAALQNPIIPAAIGLVVGGLTVHFFKVRSMGWFEIGQPWHYYALAYACGAFLIALTWTQRP